MNRATPLSETSADTRTLASGAGIALVGRILGRGAQVLVEVVLARVLGPLGFGLYATGWVVLRIVGLVAPLGLDRGVIRYGTRFAAPDTPRPAELKGVLLEALTASLVFGGVAGGLLWVASDLLATTVWSNPDLGFVFRGLAPAVALFGALRVASAATRITRRTGYAVVSEDLARPVVNLGLVACSAWAGWRLGGALMAASVSFGVAFLVALYWVLRLFPVLRDRSIVPRRTGIELFRFSATASVSGVAILILVWIDRLMLSMLRPAGEVGIYQAATQPAFVFSTILVSFNAILVPMIADLAQREAWPRMAEIYRVSTKWGIYVGLPLFIVIVFHAELAIGAIFGERYLAAALPMVILSAGQMVNAGTGAVGPLLIMTGHARRWMFFTSTMLGVAVVSNLMLIPRWGMLGAAAATAGSVALMFVGGVIQVRWIHGFWPYDRRYWKGVVAAAVAVLALYLLDRFAPLAGLPALVRLTVATAVTGVTFLSVLLGVGLDDEDRELVRLVRNRRRAGGTA